MIRIKSPATVAVILGLTAAVPCFADTPESTPMANVQIEASSFQVVPVMTPHARSHVTLSAQVKASDLDLARRQDVATLQRRVENAAKLLCVQIGERYSALVDADDRADDDACVRGAIDNAMSQIKVMAQAARASTSEESSRSG